MLIVALAAALGACKSGNDAPSASDGGAPADAGARVPHHACARPASLAATPAFGDANADGRVDIADGVFLARAELSGGPGPVCAACVDFVGKGIGADVGNAANIWYYLFAGTTPALPAVAATATITLSDPGAPPDCADVDFAIERAGAPANGTFTAAVTLETHGLALGPEAWSFGVSASGCTITAATTAGTDAADVAESPPGLRARGFDRTDVIAGGAGAVSAVVLSWRSRVGLAPGSAPRRIAMLSVHGDVPASGCATCRLAVAEGLKGRGQAVDVAVSFAGWSYTAGMGALDVELCAP